MGVTAEMDIRSPPSFSHCPLMPSQSTLRESFLIALLGDSMQQAGALRRQQNR